MGSKTSKINTGKKNILKEELILGRTNNLEKDINLYIKQLSLNNKNTIYSIDDLEKISEKLINNMDKKIYKKPIEDNNKLLIV